VISTGDCVYICDITAVVQVILQLAANSELRQKVLDLVSVLVLTKKSYLQDCLQYSPRSFAVAGPSTWNSLPAPLRSSCQLTCTFRRDLKTELFIRAYDQHARDCF